MTGIHYFFEKVNPQEQKYIQNLLLLVLPVALKISFVKTPIRTLTCGWGLHTGRYLPNSSKSCETFFFPKETVSPSSITRQGTLITLYRSFRSAKWFRSYTSAVTPGFSAATRWAAVTNSGHMVQERETRIFICAGFRDCMPRRISASKACPGPAAL